MRCDASEAPPTLGPNGALHSELKIRERCSGGVQAHSHGDLCLLLAPHLAANLMHNRAGALRERVPKPLKGFGGAKTAAGCLRLHAKEMKIGPKLGYQPLQGLFKAFHTMSEWLGLALVRLAIETGGFAPLATLADKAKWPCPVCSGSVETSKEAKKPSIFRPCHWP